MPSHFFRLSLQDLADIWRYNVNLWHSWGAVGLDIVAATEEEIPALRSFDLRCRALHQFSVYLWSHVYHPRQYVDCVHVDVFRRGLLELELGNCRGYFIGKNERMKEKILVMRPGSCLSPC